MKAILLAGGFGTRLAEETITRPKPMVEIGGIPLLVHLMRIYSAHGIEDFVIACGYKGEYIKEYFSNFRLKNSDWKIDLRSGATTVLHSALPDWSVTVVDTGLNTMTGGRIRRLKDVVGASPFLVTYGDGLADVNIAELIAFHRAHGRLATVTAVRPPARFGCLNIDGDRVAEFLEKPQTEAGWINGGFFVFEPGVFDYLPGDPYPLEKEPLERLAADGQLMAFRHEGFWQPMDTLREKEYLEKLWSSGHAPWTRWDKKDDGPQLLPRDAGTHHRPDRVQGDVARRVA